MSLRPQIQGKGVRCLVRILVVNTGSSSLKWSVISLNPEATLAEGQVAVPLGSEPDFEPVLARAGKLNAVAHRVVHGGAEVRATPLARSPAFEPLKRLFPRCLSSPASIPRSLSKG